MTLTGVQVEAGRTTAPLRRSVGLGLTGGAASAVPGAVAVWSWHRTPGDHALLTAIVLSVGS